MDYNDSEVFYDDDEDIDELRNQVNVLSTELDKNFPDLARSNTDIALNELYRQMKLKYNIQSEYQDFKGFLKSIVTQNKLDRTINEALGSKLVTSIAQRTQMKIAVSLEYLIEKSIDLIEAESNSVQVVTPEIVGMIDKLGIWYNQLEKMKADVKITDPDKTIERAIAADRREHPEKYMDNNDEEIRSDNESANVEMIRNLLDSLKQKTGK